MATILDFSVPHVLRDEVEYEAAVREVDGLLDADVERGTDGWERLRFLSVLIAAYEEERLPLASYEAGGTPQSVVRFMMEQRGMTRADLEPLMGGRSRVSEFLSGRRRLSIGQVRRLRDALRIPADLLIGA